MEHLKALELELQALVQCRNEIAQMNAEMENRTRHHQNELMRLDEQHMQKCNILREERRILRQDVDKLKQLLNQALEREKKSIDEVKKKDETIEQLQKKGQEDQLQIKRVEAQQKRLEDDLKQLQEEKLLLEDKVKEKDEAELHQANNARAMCEMTNQRLMERIAQLEAGIAAMNRMINITPAIKLEPQPSPAESNESDDNGQQQQPSPTTSALANMEMNNANAPPITLKLKRSSLPAENESEIPAMKKKAKKGQKFFRKGRK